jgi:hypothetical protein
VLHLRVSEQSGVKIGARVHALAHPLRTGMKARRMKGLTFRAAASMRGMHR